MFIFIGAMSLSGPDALAAESTAAQPAPPPPTANIARACDQAAAGFGHGEASRRYQIGLLAIDTPRAIRTCAHAALKATSQPRMLFNLGRAAFAARRFAFARRALDKAIAAGDAPAMLLRARMHRRGLAGPVDTEAEYRLIKRAAQLDHPDAVFLLGVSHEYGGPIPRDLAKAKVAYRKAIESGSLGALLRLARLEGGARGHPINEPRSQALFRQARNRLEALAETNTPYALRQLGGLYAKGQGVKQDHKKAYDLFHRARSAGDLVAVGDLGWALKRGLGVEQDVDAACDLFELRSKWSAPNALNSLGVCFGTGKGRIKDRARAAELYAQAADRRNYWGIRNLATWHDKGIHFPKDPARAVAYWGRGVKIGDPVSMRRLGYSFETGRGVDKDRTKACALYVEAESLGDATATNNLGGCFENAWIGDAPDYDKARQLYARAIDRGDTYANKNLGDLYYAGNGVDVDYPRALALYRIAAEAGHAAAMNDIGYMIDAGDGTAQNSRAGCDWYKKATEKNYRLSIRNLALCFRDGDGREKNITHALELLARAAKAGDVRSLTLSANIYADDAFDRKDMPRAFDLFQEAAAQGSTPAMRKIAHLYSEGDGVEKNDTLACDWLEKASAGKDTAAANDLGVCFLDGVGRPQDADRARDLFELAAGEDNQAALFNLANYYARRPELPDSASRATYYYGRSGDQGEMAGRLEYARRLYEGIGIAADRRGACKRYRAARAEIEEPTAWLLNTVAHCTSLAARTAREERTATELFEGAAKAGSLTAMRNLAVRFHEGTGAKKNIEQSVDWFVLALEKGHTELLHEYMEAPYVWSRRFRRRLQRRLRDKGVYDGPINGRVTEAFEVALYDRAVGGEAGKSTDRLRQSFLRITRPKTPRGMLVRLCRSQEKKPQRLLIINHGLTTDGSVRRRYRPDICGPLAEYFAKEGYAVAFPLRRGYGETGGPFVEGGRRRGCDRARDFIQAGRMIADDISAALDELAQLPGIDPTEAIILGHSGGGWGTIAAASRPDPRIAAYVNFSGVHGSRRGKPNGNCGPRQLVKAARMFGKTAKTPMLWLYVENDTHVGPAVARRLQKAFTKAGGRATLHMFPPYNDEGHQLFETQGLPIWGPVVREWLAKRSG
ncbi:MAG: dienelactone hydrolase family protein [Pseudomonadota bacterium]